KPDGRYATQPFAKRDVTMNAAGGQVATIRDLARWIIIHLDDGNLDGQQVFPASVVKRSHEVLGRQPPNMRFAYFDRDGWAMGWDVGAYEGEPMISRFGAYSNFRSHLSMLPARRLGVVAQANGGIGQALTSILAAYVYDVMLGKPEAETRGRARLDTLTTRLAALRARTAELEAAAPRRPARAVADYAGRYEDRALGRLLVFTINGELWVEWGVLRAPLLPASSKKPELMHSELLGDDTMLQFRFPAAGPAEAVQVDGRIMTAVR